MMRHPEEEAIQGESYTATVTGYAILGEPEQLLNGDHTGRIETHEEHNDFGHLFEVEVQPGDTYEIDGAKYEYHGKIAGKLAFRPVSSVSKTDLFTGMLTLSTDEFEAGITSPETSEYDIRRKSGFLSRVRHFLLG